MALANPTMVLAMEASELHRAIPDLHSVDELFVRLNANSHPNPFSLTFFTNACTDPIRRFQINLLQQEGQFHPSCFEFLNSTLCSFLRAHVGKIKTLCVRGSHHAPQFLPYLLSALGGKGITGLTMFDYTGNLVPSELGQDAKLDLLFRPLLELSVHAAEQQIEDATHSELGRLISLSSNLKTLKLRSHFRLSDVGLFNLLSGVRSSKSLSIIYLYDLQLGQCQMDALETFFDILKSLPHHYWLHLFRVSISLEGPKASYFWGQLLHNPNLSLGLTGCSIPDSVAPLIHDLFAGSDCQLPSMRIHYADDGIIHDSVTALESIYRGVALNQSIKQLFLPLYRSSRRQLGLAICSMIARNTTLTDIILFNPDGIALPQIYSMYFDALSQNQKLTNVSVIADEEPMNKETAAALGLYLESSIVLESFTLQCSVDLELATQICKGFRKSKSLKKVHFGDAPTECVDLLVEELAHNSNVVEAKFGTFQSREMDFYLALNRYGRKHLRDLSFPTKLLPFIFTRQEGDDSEYAASCIYDCLRESPHLVSTIPEATHVQAGNARERSMQSEFDKF